MIFYYFVFFVLFIFGSLYNKAIGIQRRIILFYFVFLFVLIFGFRFEVGVDWFNYVRKFDIQTQEPYYFNDSEIGFMLINIISKEVGINISGVVFISTFIFTVCTVIALEKLKLNVLYFLAISGPFYIVLSLMNLTRQSIAMSIFLLSIYYITVNKKISFSLLILLAASFHTSALLFLALIFIDVKKRWIGFILCLILPLVYFISVGRYMMYFNSSIESQGYLLRVGYLQVPGILLLLNYKKHKYLNFIEQRLCLLSILSFPLLMLLSLISTTVADRISYYFIILSIIMVMIIVSRSNNKSKWLLINQSNFLMSFCGLLIFFVWSIYSPRASFYEFRYLFFK